MNSSHAEHQRELEERRRREEECSLASDPAWKQWSDAFDKETQKRQDEEHPWPKE